jgi:hypothetical protein
MNTSNIVKDKYSDEELDNPNNITTMNKIISIIPDKFDNILKLLLNERMKKEILENKENMLHLIRETVSVIVKNSTKLNNNMPLQKIPYSDDDIQKLRSKLTKSVVDETDFYCIVLNSMDDGKLWFFYKAFERLQFIIDPIIANIENSSNKNIENSSNSYIAITLFIKICKFFKDFRENELYEIEEVIGGYPQQGGMHISFLTSIIIVLIASFSLCNASITTVKANIIQVANNIVKQGELGFVEKAVQKLANNVKQGKNMNGLLEQGVNGAKIGAENAFKQFANKVVGDLIANAQFVDKLKQNIARDAISDVIHIANDKFAIDGNDGNNVQKLQNVFEIAADKYDEITNKYTLSGINQLLKLLDPKGENISTFVMNEILKGGYGVKDALAFVEAMNIIFDEFYKLVDDAIEAGHELKRQVDNAGDALHIKEGVNNVVEKTPIQAVVKNPFVQVVAKNQFVQVGVKAVLSQYGVNANFVANLVKFLDSGEIDKLIDLKNQLSVIKTDLENGLFRLGWVVRILYFKGNIIQKGTNATNLFKKFG